MRAGARPACSRGLAPLTIVGVTVLEVIQRSAEFLAKKGVDSPRLQAELLLAHLLKLEEDGDAIVRDGAWEKV